MARASSDYLEIPGPSRTGVFARNDKWIERRVAYQASVNNSRVSATPARQMFIISSSWRW
jgi:hypothetical protein